MDRRIVRTQVVRYRGGSFVRREDRVAGEEPLEIRIGGRAYATTMRTPGNDIELVHGFLHGEAIISDPSDVLSVRYCDGVDEQGRNTYNVVDVELAPGVPDPVPDRARAVTATSACGVCGSASIEAITRRSRYAPGGPARMEPEDIIALTATLRESQPGFGRTGGMHGAGLAEPDGSMSLVREDVGRHCAVDKVIGAALLAGRLPLATQALVTSSRASFELVQKALLAGIGTLIAVSAPSSLAVELAQTSGMTVIGFVRESGFNVYSGAHRVATSDSRSTGHPT